MQYKDHETLIKSAEDHFLHGLLYWYFPVQAQVASFKVFLHRLSEFLATSNLFLSDVSLWSQWYYTSVNLVCDQCLMTRLFSAVTYELFWNSLPNIFMRIFYFQPKCPKFCDMQLFEVKLFYSWALYKNIYWIWKKNKKSVSATDFCTFYLPKSLQSEKVWSLNLHVDIGKSTWKMLHLLHMHGFPFSPF